MILSFDFVNDVQIWFDEEKKIIHVLDKWNGKMTVTNGIEYIQEEILGIVKNKFPSLEGGGNNMVWYLYATDGYVSQFDKGEFRRVHLDDTSVCKEFIPIMIERFSIPGEDRYKYFKAINGLDST